MALARSSPTRRPPSPECRRAPRSRRSATSCRTRPTPCAGGRARRAHRSDPRSCSRSSASSWRPRSSYLDRDVARRADRRIRSEHCAVHRGRRDRRRRVGGADRSLRVGLARLPARAGPTRSRSPAAPGSAARAAQIAARGRRRMDWRDRDRRSLVVGPSVPGAGGSPLLVYKEIGRGTEGNLLSAPPPILHIQDKLTEGPVVELFSVKSPRPAYWRVIALDWFTDDNAWGVNKATERSASTLTPPVDLPPFKAATPAVHDRADRSALAARRVPAREHQPARGARRARFADAPGRLDPAGRQPHLRRAVRHPRPVASAPAPFRSADPGA